MQVVARARAAGLTCRPRDIFVEQTVAGLARVAGVAGGGTGPVDEGLGPVLPTPIMRWLHNVDGPIDQFNQTMVVQAPAGVTHADVVVVLQALLDRHAMLRLRVDDDGTGGWSLRCPSRDRCTPARACMSVDVLSDEALRRGPVAVEPGRRGDAQRAVGDLHRPAGADHSPPGRRRGVLADPVGRPQHRLGPTPQRTTDRPAGAGHLVPAVGPAAGRARPRPRRWSSRPTPGNRSPRPRRRCRRPTPQLDTYASAGHLSVSLDAETTRQLLGEVPAAFHAGIHDILLIAYALAWTEFLGTGDAPIGIDVEGHGRHEDLAADLDLSRTVGWFTTKYPVALTVGGLRWTQVIAGDAALGPIIKNAKEQLRTLPEGLTYGLLRYLNPDIDLPEPDPDDRIQLPRTPRRGRRRGRMSSELWRISQDGLSVTDAATAVPMPLAHTVELNAGTVDTDTGPHLHATWTWAPSALDHTQISRLSQLWFDALTGICAHVAHGGGGLTPSDIAPARLSQHQIDQLHQHYRIADILPLTPLQQGLLFHATTTDGNDDDLYAMQLDITVTGPLDPAPAARCRAHRAHPPPQPGRPILPTIRPTRTNHPRRPPGALAIPRPRTPTRPR